LADNNSSSKSGSKKRRLKNPETIRQQALRTQADAGKPAKSAKVRGASKKAFAPLSKLGKLSSIKPLRWLGLIIVPPYLRSSWRELRLVTWPNRRESYRLTVAVIIFSVIFGVLIAVTDWGLDKLFKNILLK
jgi:preprotein translocase SecE subunit